MNTIEEWKKEVTEYLETINIQLQKSEDSKNLYYGFEVIDGQLKMNPEILFIGINPGKGGNDNGEKNYEIILESERISYLDDFDGNYHYQLARETVNVFKLVGLNEDEIISKLENNCVKTNFFHIVTQKDNHIEECLNKNSETNHIDYWHKSAYFNIQLIRIIKPKIVIFEGKKPYDYIIKGCYEIKNSWNSTLGFGYYYSESENIHFIGYKRIYSNIATNKEIIAEKLKSIL